MGLVRGYVMACHRLALVIFYFSISKFLDGWGVSFFFCLFGLQQATD